MKRFALKTSATIICCVLFIGACITVVADSTAEGITITIKNATTNYEVPYEDCAYATIYPSSIYGIVYRMNNNIDGFTEAFPDMAFNYPTVSDFSIDKDYIEYGSKFQIFEFYCIIPFKLTIVPENEDDLLSDWEEITLEWNPNDWGSNSEEQLEISMVFVALFKACDITLSNDEALSLVTLLLQNFHGMGNFNETRKEYNGFYYDMYNSFSGYNEVQIIK